jgi:hypothetical protein
VRAAEIHNYEVKMKSPCPKEDETPSRLRYLASMSGRTIKELKALGSTTEDIKWNYQHGWMTFPGRESKRSGHIFNVHVLSTCEEESEKPKIGTERNSAMNQVLTNLYKELTHEDEKRLAEMLGDKLRCWMFGLKYGEELLSLNAYVNGATRGRAILNQYVDWHIAAEPRKSQV